MDHLHVWNWVNCTHTIKSNHPVTSSNFPCSSEISHRKKKTLLRLVFFLKTLKENFLKLFVGPLGLVYCTTSRFRFSGWKMSEKGASLSNSATVWSNYHLAKCTKWPHVSIGLTAFVKLLTGLTTISYETPVRATAHTNPLPQQTKARTFHK